LRSVDADVAHVATIKKALGDRASVRVDVNEAWSEPEARRRITALEAAGVDLIELPLPRDNRGAQARLSGRFEVPLMADEALHGTTSGIGVELDKDRVAFFRRDGYARRSTMSRATTEV
jgi:muconate cycloisomerase